MPRSKTKKPPIHIEPITLTIPLEPVPKGRPRVTFQHSRIWTFDPPHTQEAQDRIKAFLEDYKHLCIPAHVPVKLTVTFYRTKGKWLPKYETLPYRKPDLVNFEALLCDALSSMLYYDDAQITTIISSKRWSTNGQGHIDISITEDALEES